MVLYASTYDDIPLVVNVAGRFWMDKGITMRFGEDIFERAQAGPVAMPAQRDDGHTFTWMLTKEVSQQPFFLLLRFTGFGRTYVP